MYVHKTPLILKLLFNKFLWSKNNQEKKIYLTFDDGPIPEITPFVLKELEKRGAKATFFCVGDNVRKYPQILDQILADGHSVGNHTFSHLNGWKTDFSQYLADVALCQLRLEENGVKRNGSGLFRPPYGKITLKQAKALYDFQIVMWDVLSYDYDQSLDPESCLERTIQATRPGSIVLFHDSLKAEKSLKYALPRYLDHFVGKGFEFVAIK